MDLRVLFRAERSGEQVQGELRLDVDGLSSHGVYRAGPETVPLIFGKPARAALTVWPARPEPGAAPDGWQAMPGSSVRSEARRREPLALTPRAIGSLRRRRRRRGGFCLARRWHSQGSLGVALWHREGLRRQVPGLELGYLGLGRHRLHLRQLLLQLLRLLRGQVRKS